MAENYPFTVQFICIIPAQTGMNTLLEYIHV